MAAEEAMTERIGYLLGKLGQLATVRLAERLAPLRLRPRHCGVLESLRGAPVSQLDLARALGVTPSVIVDMLDELEELGAVRRVRDGADRRRQLVELTPTGQRLGRRARQLAQRLDTELLAALEPRQARALHESLRRLAEAGGLLDRDGNLPGASQAGPPGTRRGA
jgi:DNA-binding MarR family transcriptional regulator